METYSTDTPISIHDATLIPVVWNYQHTHINNLTRWFAGNKEPRAVIVCDANGIRAFDMLSQEVSITSLEQIIPNLNAILKPYLHIRQ